MVFSNRVKKIDPELKIEGKMLDIVKKTVSNVRGHFIWPQKQIYGEEINVTELMKIHMISRTYYRGNYDVFSVFKNRGLPYISNYIPFRSTVLQNSSKFHMVNESTFLSNFNTMFPGITNIIGSMNVSEPCVAACGGSVSRCLLNQSNDSSDVDLFIFGVSEEDFRSKEGELLSHFKEGMSNLRVLSKIIEFEWNKIKIQIIRRCYDNMPSIIHGFDISACSVAFDGREVFMTHRALFAYQHRMIIIDPELDRSKTYERRLAKYYNRGFSILLQQCYIRGTGIKIFPKMEIHVAKNTYNKEKCVTFIKLEKNGIVPKGNSIYDDYEEYRGRRLSNITKLMKYNTQDLSYIVKGDITENLLEKSTFLQKLFNGSKLFVYDFFDTICEGKSYKKPHSDYFPNDIIECISEKCGYFEKMALSSVFHNRDFLPEIYKYKHVKQLVVDEPWKQFTGSMNPSTINLYEYLGDFFKP
jgi:hypothetical protein